ncbi:hypothetical protein [Methanosarcina sp. UBA5]|uniref:hypothetical protein n=1 Tax=Methanosarcina sp. UBA5 TaxID=1915593 RepID=UPI0025FE33A4|nr:hypothetical protein [Methanosarcina sp. UBA5]
MTASLFKKGLSENVIVGVINQRDGCGSTVYLYYVSEENFSDRILSSLIKAEIPPPN